MTPEQACKRIMLVYPPGKKFQRGEDRCQGNVEDSSATNLHACNDLGYVAAGLKGLPYRVFLRDYMGEGLSEKIFFGDVRKFRPDLIFMSITAGTVKDDISLLNRIADLPGDIVVILKGALFYDASQALTDDLDLAAVDYLIGGESDFTAARLIHSHFRQKSPEKIPGILYKKDNRWLKTDFSIPDENPDRLRFPDRSLMNNAIYVRPDTDEPQATITVARGCPSSCIFCLTPVISGKRIRSRSPENVYAEIEECFFRYGISNFFLKADTFTMDKLWVEAFCHRILQSPLKGRIQWVANSKTRPADPELFLLMKEAGCWLIAFGFESGSPETMAKLKKGTLVEDSYRAAAAAKAAGLKIFGFFMAGFFWENKSDLEKTRKLIFDLDADFIEIHIPVLYPGTEMHRLSGLAESVAAGRDYYKNPVPAMKNLTPEQVISFRKRVMKQYYFRPSYILKRFREAVENPVVLKNYSKYALMLFYKSMIKA